MKRVFLTIGFVLGLSSFASAQTATSYTARYYNVGASSPVQSETFAASAAVCNLTAPSSTSTVNPNEIVFDDFAHAGKVCIYSEATSGPLFSVPVGSYEGTLSATNAAGTSGESVRFPFSRLALEPVPTNVKFVR